jgi:hypothetical protein
MTRLQQEVFNMTSITYKDLFNSRNNYLKVPDGTESMSTLQAALAWASNGFYVLPIEPETKHPGSVVGTGWPEKSSRDPRQIEIWFRAGTNYGLAIHVGRSGAIAFDVDDPKHLPHKLFEWLNLGITPYQSTRNNERFRGHYLFATPLGSNYGNSKGYLKGAWGEVRGKNGIIVVSPTPHSKATHGGQYLWERTGSLALLPYELQKVLPIAHHQSVQAINLDEAETFFLDNTKSDCSELLSMRLSGWFQGGSRHDACRDLLLVCMLDARAGLYSAKTSVERIANLFVSIKPQDEWSSPKEFIDMTLWAIAIALKKSEEEIDIHRKTQLTIASPQVAEWIKHIND